MIIRKLRLQRGWSQEQLAEFSGLSIRTIQRIERGQNPGLESLKSLATVFEVQLSDLQSTLEHDMKIEQQLPPDEEKAIVYVRDLKGFYSHLIKYVVVISILFIINLSTNRDYIWAWWPMLGWGLGIMTHGLNVFEVFHFFSPAWEKRQIEKRIGGNCKSDQPRWIRTILNRWQYLCNSIFLRLMGMNGREDRL